MQGKRWIIAGLLLAVLGAGIWWGLQPGRKTGLPRAVEKAAPYIAPLVKIERMRVKTLSRDKLRWK